MLSLFVPVIASFARSVDEVGYVYFSCPNYDQVSTPLRIRTGVAYIVTSFAFLSGTPISGALLNHGNSWSKPIIFNGVSHTLLKQSNANHLFFPFSPDCHSRRSTLHACGSIYASKAKRHTVCITTLTGRRESSTYLHRYIGLDVGIPVVQVEDQKKIDVWLEWDDSSTNYKSILTNVALRTSAYRPTTDSRSLL